MTDTSKNLLERIKTIPLFNDAAFRRGERSSLNSMTSIHYVIYPFLQILGYDVFNPEKMKMAENLNGEILDIGIYEDNSRILGMTVKNFNETSNLSLLDTAFKQKGLSLQRSLNIPVSIATNGVLYAIYIEGEIVAKFDITNLENERVDFLFKLLSRENLKTITTNPKFLKEAQIESKYGNLRNSAFVKEALLNELKNPSDALLETLLNSIYTKYCNTLDIEEFRNQFKGEIRSNDSSLLHIVAKSTTTATTTTATQLTEPITKAPSTNNTSNPTYNAPKVEETKEVEVEVKIETPTYTNPYSTPVEPSPAPQQPQNENVVDYTSLTFLEEDDNDGEGENLSDLLLEE